MKYAQSLIHCFAMGVICLLRTPLNSACPNEECTEEVTVEVRTGDPIRAVITSPQTQDCTAPPGMQVNPCCNDLHGDQNGDGDITVEDIALFLQIKMVGIQYDEHGNITGCGGDPYDFDEIEWTTIETDEINGNPCVNYLDHHLEKTNDRVEKQWISSNFNIKKPGTYYVKGRVFNPDNLPGTERLIRDMKTWWDEGGISADYCWEWKGFDTKYDNQIILEMPVTVKPGNLWCAEPAGWDPGSTENLLFDIQRPFAEMIGNPGTELKFVPIMGLAGNVTGSISWKKILSAVGTCAMPKTGSAHREWVVRPEADAELSAFDLVKAAAGVSVQYSQGTEVNFNCGLQGSCRIPKLEIWQKRLEAVVAPGAMITRVIDV